MNKWPAGPAQSKESSKRVLSLIYLFKSRRSAGAYLFIQKPVDFPALIFSFFSFSHSSGTRKSLIYLFKIVSIFQLSFFIFSFFSFFRHAEIARSFIPKPVGFPALICHCFHSTMAKKPHSLIQNEEARGALK